ncbi:MAG: secretion protein HlyD, partial [Proteobacteria bacterium]|nr:secretion protein HlyD [Pseudomonadota bacterium]
MFAYRIWLVAGALILAGCSGDSSESSPAHDGHEESNEVAPQQGSHGGRLLVDGEFVAELAIFEAGTAPEFRVWITDAGEPIASSEVDLRVTLARLGNVKDEIVFSGEGEFLRSTTTVVEPHSFVVNVEARHANVTHRWVYDNFEGRT